MVGLDDTNTTTDEYTTAAVGETPTFNQNSMNLELPALKNTVAKSWGNDILKAGSMVMWYRDTGKKNVAGITPLLEQKPPPWIGTDTFFFDTDIKGAPFFAPNAKSTTTSGLVVVKKAPVKTFGGSKAGCKVEAGTGGSSPNTIFFRIFDVSGC